MSGNYYQTYAYTLNNKNTLSLDSMISNNPNLSGFDGLDNCKTDLNPEGIVDCELTYKCKTITNVKKYLEHKYR